MSEKYLRQQNLARVENPIAELKISMLELQDRIQRREAAGRNTEIPRALLAVLGEHLEVIKIRHRQAQDYVAAGQIIRKTGCQQEA